MRLDKWVVLLLILISVTLTACTKPPIATPSVTVPVDQGAVLVQDGEFFLTVTKPLDNQVLESREVKVKGVTSPSAVVTVNDEICDVDQLGNFKVTLNLEEGLNLITIEASNAEGKDLIVELTVDVELK